MITLKNVSKTYQTGEVEVHALNNVNLTIEKGEMVVLNGVSGSGKTTLLNLLGAMDTPTNGEILFDDENITNYTSSRLTTFRAKKVGFIFQSFNLIPTLTVYENIVVPMKLKGQSFEKDRIMQLIEAVGLIKHYKHRPDQLSGGQKQRVAISRAIAHEPLYVMADEPTASLDSATAMSIIELLKDLNNKLQVTVVFASHDPTLKDAISKKVNLKDGYVVD